MRDFTRFIGLCCKAAFCHTRGILDFASTVLGILVPLLVFAFRKASIAGQDDAMNDLYWECPLGLVAAFGAARLLISPYWVWKEVKNERDALLAKADVIHAYFFEETNGSPYESGLTFRVVNKTDRDIYIGDVELFGTTTAGKEEAIKFERVSLYRNGFWGPPLESRNRASITFHITLQEIAKRGYKEIFAVTYLKDDSVIKGERMAITPPPSLV